MNKGDIIRAIAKETELTKTQIDEVINVFLETVKNAVNNEEMVQLLGFGSFRKISRKARKGRNPKTGVEIDIKPSKTVVFKVGQPFKDILK